MVYEELRLAHVLYWKKHSPIYRHKLFFLLLPVLHQDDGPAVTIILTLQWILARLILLIKSVQNDESVVDVSLDINK